MSKTFIDTNILINCLDSFNLEKRSQSRQLLKSITESLDCVISTQVIQEFYVTATQKLKLDPLTAKEIMHSFEHFEVVMVTVDMIKDAVDCSILNKISFWDSLIISAAEHAKCRVLWTEDLNNGQLIRGVKVINPYHNQNH